MKRILRLIEGARESLPANPLFVLLSDEDVDGHDRLSWAPAMLYYLMGFKDVLGALARTRPESDLDRKINAYCIEDAEHWRWYLEDLEKLGFSIESWGADVPALCNEVWSEALKPNRATIFSLIHYARLATDPLLALTLIQIFEATGVVFIGHTRKAAIAAGMDDTLKYFGRVHYEEEFSHTVQSQDLEDYSLSAESMRTAEAAVRELFVLFDEMFSAWHAHRGRYPTKRDI
jgi:hypothetical protein